MAYVSRYWRELSDEQMDALFASSATGGDVRASESPAAAQA
jgi:hypothetical protein